MNPFPSMKVRHVEVKQIIQAAVDSSIEEKISARDRFDAAHRAKLEPTTLENWTNKRIKESTDQSCTRAEICNRGPQLNFRPARSPQLNYSARKKPA